MVNAGPPIHRLKQTFTFYKSYLLLKVNWICSLRKKGTKFVYIIKLIYNVMLNVKIKVNKIRVYKSMTNNDHHTILGRQLKEKKEIIGLFPNPTGFSETARGKVHGAVVTSQRQLLKYLSASFPILFIS